MDVVDAGHTKVNPNVKPLHDLKKKKKKDKSMQQVLYVCVER